MSGNGIAGSASMILLSKVDVAIFCYNIQKFSKFYSMAIPIQTIPILTGKQAKRFLEIARKNEAEKAGTLDFSEHFSMVKRILSRSKNK
jgi:hypothetical protein